MTKRRSLITKRLIQVRGVIVTAIFVLGLFMSPLPVMAANQVIIDMAEDGAAGTVDTAIVGTDYEFRIFIENDMVWMAMQHGIQIYSPEGASWNWNFQADGYGPLGPGSGGYLTVPAGCRMDPTGTVWDMTNLLVPAPNLDGISPDSIFPGGLAMNAGLQTGPSEHMMSLHLTPTSAAASGAVGTICLDSSFIPPSGAFLFSDAGGATHTMTIDGPFCWPVIYNCPYDSDGDGYGDPDNPQNDCPDDNCPSIANTDQADDDSDGIGNVCDNCPDEANPTQSDADGDGIGDACDPCTDSDNDGFGDPGYPNPSCEVDNCAAVYNPDQADADDDGAGDACDNCQGTQNPDQNNSDGDIYGDACDNCPTVDNESQVNSDGDQWGDACDNCPAVDNPDQTDTDEDGIGDACDACPEDPDNDIDGDGICGDVDNCPETYNPDQADLNEDGVGDVCEFLCGDANGDGEFNIGDAIFLINYYFRKGPPPPYLNAADVNGDGKVSLTDIIMMISRVFIYPEEFTCP